MNDIGADEVVEGGGEEIIRILSTVELGCSLFTNPIGSLASLVSDILADNNHQEEENELVDAPGAADGTGARDRARRAYLGAPDMSDIQDASDDKEGEE